MNPKPAQQACPSCRKPLNIPLSAAGKTVRCPGCQTDFTVPAVPTAVPLPVPVPAAGDPFDFHADSPEPAQAEKSDELVYFTVVEPRTWSTNRVYRIYADRDELVGVWIGAGDDLAMAAAAGGGLIGGMIAAKNAKKNAKRQADLDEMPLEKLRRSHPNNFVLAAEDIKQAEIVGTSFWFRLNHSTVPQVALLKLKCRNGRTLALATTKDLGTAINMLEELIGDRLSVKVKYRR